MADQAKEATDMGVIPGMEVEVELLDGSKFIGRFGWNGITGDPCVRNAYGFPLVYKKLIRKI